MKIRRGNFKLISMVLWLFILAIFVSWFEMNNRWEDRQRALKTANAFFQVNLITRKWNASHSGVYVPITAKTQPNQYLPIENRDLVADNGFKLTRINPAYMTRQIAELAKENFDNIQLHITSLKPINPKNKPTDLEVKWLKSFEQGSKEQGEFFESGDITWFRYMAPLFTRKDCLQCHAQQGYKEGDIRGGISVSIQYPSRGYITLIIGVGSVAVIGLAFIYIGGHLYERKQRLFDATFNSPIPCSVTGKDHTILLANDSYWQTFGALPDNKQSIKCYDHRPGTLCHTDDCTLKKIINGKGYSIIETDKEINGKVHSFIVTTKPLLDSQGKVIGCVESYQEITERKKIEEELQEANKKLECLSTTDGLTGIANRRHFDHILDKEYARHVRSGAQLSLLMLDLDHFKLFNDYYGHISGDKCLQQIGRVLNDCAGRSADLAARYGGEEFACILPETGRDGAFMVAEGIHREIMALAIPHKKSKVADCITASFGLVTTQCTTDKSALDLVVQADRLLYKAKASGRNCIKTAIPSDAEGDFRVNFAQLVWQDSYCCGNQVIDSQHRSLFDLSNELFEAALSGRSTIEVSAIITKLLDSAKQHFQDEEALLESLNFPALNQHVGEHSRMLKKGGELLGNFNASRLTIGDVFEFLASEFVMHHMLEVDQEFYPFIGKEPDQS